MHAWEYWTLPASGATWMLGQTSVVADIFKCDARKMYRENWDGCRDLWKENYRLSKLARRSTLITRLSVRVAQPNVEKIYTLPALPSPLPSAMPASWWEALVLQYELERSTRASHSLVSQKEIAIAICRKRASVGHLLNPPSNIVRLASREGIGLSKKFKGNPVTVRNTTLPEHSAVCRSDSLPCFFSQVLLAFSARINLNLPRTI